MDILKLEQKLLAAARSQPARDAVPYAFEKRIMARLRAIPVFDPRALWANALMRAAAPCVALALAVSAWSFFMPSGSTPAGDLGQEFDNTILAAAFPDSAGDVVW